MKMLPLLLSIGSLLTCNAGLPQGPPAIAISFTAPVDPSPGVLFMAWPDGTAIWSENPEEGGPPFRIAKREPGKIVQFLAKLEKDRLFERDEDFLVQIGPDSSYHSIDVRSGKSHVEFISWHEIFETNPKLAVTSDGVVVLDGSKREDLMRESTKEYLDFRKRWDEVRRFAREITSKGGKRWEGTLKLESPWLENREPAGEDP